jgi:hypothetical protein
MERDMKWEFQIDFTINLQRAPSPDGGFFIAWKNSASEYGSPKKARRIVYMARYLNLGDL